MSKKLSARRKNKKAAKKPARKVSTKLASGKSASPRLVKPVKAFSKANPKASKEKQLGQLKALFEIVERAKYIWESTFDAIVNPVMIVDRNFRIERANLALSQAIGRDVRTLIGTTCHEVFAGRKQPCEGCPLPQTWKSRQTSSSRLGKFSDGREYQAVGFPLKGKHDDLDLSIVQYRDIREERHLQARLIQSEKMAAVGLLAGGIAHEINNPLSGILAFAQLALAQVPEGGQLQEDIKEIESSALRCKKIVENLLEFSRQSSIEERNEVDLKATFERVLPLMKLQVKEAGVALDVQVDESLPSVLANGNQLEQVFLNLTSNACHALERGGKVHIAAHAELPGWVVIDFNDNGVGIKKEILPKIFDPFFTTKKSGMGTGLGLSIIYNIIQDHAGKIEVLSEENQGTTFRIYLPTSSSAEISNDVAGSSFSRSLAHSNMGARESERGNP